MIKVIKNYLKELGVEYTPGMMVRVRTWQSNSSSDHTCYISYQPVMRRLNIDDYPTLKERIVNNVLFIERTDQDDYQNKQSFYFSPDHYTVIDKINYALALAYNKSQYRDSLYTSRSFSFTDKRELEESKRLLIKYYATVTHRIKRILVEHFDLDNVVFPQAKYVRAFLSINSTNPDDVFKTLVEQGVYNEDDDDELNSLRESKNIDIDSYIDFGSIDHQSIDDMETNILENDDTLSSFILSDKSEVYPVYEGNNDEVRENMMEKGIVATDETSDDKVSLSCNILLNYDESCHEVTSVMEASAFEDFTNDVRYLITEPFNKKVKIYNRRSKKEIKFPLKQRRGYCAELRYDEEKSAPVLEIYESNYKPWDERGITIPDKSQNVGYIDDLKRSLVTKDGKLVLCGFHCKVDDKSKLIELIEELDKKFPESLRWRPDDDKKLPTVIWDFKNLLQALYRHESDDAGLIMPLNCQEELFDLFDLNDSNYFEKVGKSGMEHYWVKFSKIDYKKFKVVPCDSDFLEICEKVLGSDFIDHMCYLIPITVNYKNVK